MDKAIKVYNDSQVADRKAICDLLYQEIKRGLPDLENKIWHGAPVWFIEGNPIVGYDVLIGSVRLLFWSGQSFDEPSLKPEGTFKAAEFRYTKADQVNSSDIQRWLEKAQKIQWDYKNIVKKHGVLERLK